MRPLLILAILAIASMHPLADHMRIGEAQNPGPPCLAPQVDEARLDVAFRRPDQLGFHGARSAGLEGVVTSGDKQEVGGPETYQLVVDTCNGTTWPGIRRYLRRTRADLVLAQEHHLPPAAIAGASQQALRRGWQSIWLPAQPSDNGGWKAGVVILARDPVRISYPRAGGCEVSPSRVVAALAEAPGYRPFTAYSGYLIDGEALSNGNLGILADIGTHVKLQGEHHPYLLGADFQLPPQLLETAGFADQVGGTIVATGLRRGTCRSIKACSEIDYFVMNAGVALGLAKVSTVEGAGTRPHVPVRATFHPQQVAMRTLVLRKPPPPLAIDRLHGPLRPLPDDSGLEARTNALAERARKDDRDEVSADFERLFREWADLAEEELAEVTGTKLSKSGLRGREPRLVWRSIVPERQPKPIGRKADAWRWMASVLAEVRRLGRHLKRGARLVEGGEGVAWEGCDDDDFDLAEALPGDIPDSDDFMHADADAMTDGTPIDILNEALDLKNSIWSPPESAQIIIDSGGEDAEALGKAMDSVLGAIDNCVDAASAHAGAADDSGEDANARAAKVVAWDAACAGIDEDIRRAAKEADAQEAGEERQAWRSWLRTNIDKGARNAHLALKIPEEWRPTATVSTSGQLTADPMNLLEGYLDKYCGLWKDDNDDREFCDDPQGWGQRVALARPSPEELQTASSSFAPTSDTYDGFNVRHYRLLCTPALRVVGAFMEIAELMGGLPRQLRMIPMPLIGKARGGHRAIASFTSFYRLWARVRRPVAQKWEDANDRPYFAAGKGRAPCDVVWRQAARAEASIGEGCEAGALLWDMASFFENISRTKLRRRLVAAGFPLAIARLALAAYAGPRVLSLEGALAAPTYAWRGVAAGCGFATTFIRVYCIAPFDNLVRELQLSLPIAPPILDAYIDDLTLNATGTKGEVLDALTTGYELLKEVVEEELECEIEVGKAAVVASSKDIARTLTKKFGKYAGKACLSTPNLGIDYAPGRRRAVHSKRGKRATRHRGLTVKAAKLAGLKPILGRMTGRIFCAGPLPFASYDAAVNGLSDAEVLRFRRAAARAYSPKAKGRSLTMLTLLEHVPTWRAEVAAAIQYSKEVWRAALLGGKAPRRGEMSLTDIGGVFDSVDGSGTLDAEGGRRRWHNVRGPIAAMVLTLHRISWSMKGPYTFVTDRGDEVPLTKYAPVLVSQMLHEAVGRTLERTLGKKAADEGDARFVGRRACLDHVRSRLKGDRRLDAKGRAIYRSVLCGAIMTLDKAARSGYLVEDLCPMCGCRGDGVHHRIWCCMHPRVAAAREAVAPGWLIAEARRAGPSSWIFNRGVVPHPGDIWPAPPTDANIYIYPGGREMGDGGVGDRTLTHFRATPPRWADVEGNTMTEFCAAAASNADSGTVGGSNGGIRLAGQLYVDGSCTTEVFSGDTQSWCRCCGPPRGCGRGGTDPHTAVASIASDGTSGGVRWPRAAVQTHRRRDRHCIGLRKRHPRSPAAIPGRHAPWQKIRWHRQGVLGCHGAGQHYDPQGQGPPNLEGFSGG